MRIRVAGRSLEVPQDARPTQDHVRRSLFDRLGSEIAGTRMLELFAGSGAVGIEALCRGASFAVFVEKGRPGAMAIAENLRKLGLSERAMVMRRGVSSALRELARGGESFDWGFADPPYGFPSLGRCLSGLHHVIAMGGLFILETRRVEELPVILGLEPEDEWRMRDVKLGIYRRISG
ncbi:MAG: RsmD family RNA methyltransferase [candidate division WOR-3 bacterium]